MPGINKAWSQALAVAAATAATYMVRRTTTHSRPCTSSFTVLSWNVLAAEFTMYNREPPGCIQGHRNREHKLEAPTQTAARYSIATDALLEQAPDAVLLQELSVQFLDSQINPRAEALLAEFEVAHVTNSAGPGTAVLLRKDGALTNTGLVFTVGAVEETGGNSKSASAVLVSLDDGRRCWIVSVHLTPHKFNPKAVFTHLELLAEAMRANNTSADQPPAKIVVGGDLNADLQEVAVLQRECAFLGELLHVDAMGNTGLSADFSKPEYIDHFFTSAGLRVVDGVGLEKKPASPYGVSASGGAAPVVGASDHVWQHISVELE